MSQVRVDSEPVSLSFLAQILKGNLTETEHRNRIVLLPKDAVLLDVIGHPRADYPYVTLHYETSLPEFKWPVNE